MKTKEQIILPNLKPTLKAIFIDRPNRFLARIKINGNNNPTFAHIHDPGRLTELLVPGALLLLQEVSNPKRKTKYDVLFVKYHNYWVLINSQYHNQLARIALASSHLDYYPLRNIKAEYSIGKSRLDFYAETLEGTPVFIEVKGCTLKKNNVALFPDAPTTRGQKHLHELTTLVTKNKNKRALIIFLVFHKHVSCFSPNQVIDPKFTQEFYNAIQHGVDARILEFAYDPSRNAFHITKRIPLC